MVYPFACVLVRFIDLKKAFVCLWILQELKNTCLTQSQLRTVILFQGSRYKAVSRSRQMIPEPSERSLHTLLRYLSSASIIWYGLNDIFRERSVISAQNISSIYHFLRSNGNVGIKLSDVLSIRRNLLARCAALITNPPNFGQYRLSAI